MQKLQGTNERYRHFSELELWREYAKRKQEWQDKNPSATAEQYDSMIDRLCRELGV